MPPSPDYAIEQFYSIAVADGTSPTADHRVQPADKGMLNSAYDTQAMILALMQWT